MVKKKTLINYHTLLNIIAFALLIFGIRTYLYTVKNAKMHNPYFSTVSIITILIGTISVMLTAYLTIKKEWNIEQIFPVIALSLGVMFLLVMPIFTKPDEGYHFDATYNLSNDILKTGRPDNTKNMYMRTCDSEYRITLFKEGAYQKFGDLFSNQPNTSLTEKEDTSYGDASIGGYIIPALGITLARALHLNFPILSIIGAMCNLLWFTLWTTYALKKLPFGQRTLFFILLLPATIQQVSSYSRDNSLIIAGVLVVALTLHWRYSEEKIKPTECVVYIAASYVLLTVKSSLYAYMIFFALFLLIHKEWFTGKYGRYVKGGVIIIVIAAVVILLPLHGWEKIYTVLSIEPYQANTGVYGHSPLYYITNPLELFDRLGYTIGRFGNYYLYQLTGWGMGCLEVFNSEKAKNIYLLLAIGSVVRIQGENFKLGVQTRVFSILFGVGGILLCFVAMLLFWTDPSSRMIDGIQGRYFIPVLFPLLLGIGFWKKPVLKLDLNKYYPTALAGMGYVMAVCILRYNALL